jgi:hypothetical protein
MRRAAERQGFRCQTPIRAYMHTHARARTRPACLEALFGPSPGPGGNDQRPCLQPSDRCNFDSSLPRYRRARSVKRNKLGELLYRDLANRNQKTQR